jgi:hypothetical protein
MRSSDKLQYAHNDTNCSFLSDFFQEFLRVFIQENLKIQNFEYKVKWKTLIRTKWHQVLLSSLQLAIPNNEIWVLKNFYSKKFKISKFWVCHFLTITKIHLLFEYINSLNSSLLMLLMLMFFKNIFDGELSKKSYWMKLEGRERWY